MQLRELRHEVGLSLQQFGEMCGISRNHVSYIELGERTPALPKARKIVEVISNLTGRKLSIEDVFFGEYEPKQRKGA